MAGSVNFDPTGVDCENFGSSVHSGSLTMKFRSMLCEPHRSVQTFIKAARRTKNYQLARHIVELRQRHAATGRSNKVFIVK